MTHGHGKQCGGCCGGGIRGLNGNRKNIMNIKINFNVHNSKNSSDFTVKDGQKMNEHIGYIRSDWKTPQEKKWEFQI